MTKCDRSPTESKVPALNLRVGRRRRWLDGSFLLFAYLVCTMTKPDWVNHLLQGSGEEEVSHTRAFSRITMVEQFPRRNRVSE